MVELNEKALEAAREAYTITKSRGVGVEFEDGALEDAIIAYLSSLPAPDDGLVERLRETHTCDGCGEYVGSIIHDLCDEAATALQSKDEQIRRLKKLDAEYGRVETAIIMADPTFDGDSDRANCGDRLIASVHRMKEQIERLTRERDEVSSSLEYLLVGYVGRYCDPVPEWQPLPTLGGIISQLDNAMTVTATFKDRAEAAEQQVQKLTAENERLRKALRPFAEASETYDEFWATETDGQAHQDEEDAEMVTFFSLGSDINMVPLSAFRLARSALETQEGGK